MSQIVTEREAPGALPASPAEWQACAAHLQARQAENDAERARLARQREALALAAATGDGRAQKRVQMLAGRDQALALDAMNIAQGLAHAEIAIARSVADRAGFERQEAVRRHQVMLESRLSLIAEIELVLRSMPPLLVQLAEATRLIEESHLALGGERPTLPPLAQEAAGGRLAEFMTGIGFAAWLPLARPEIRPAIQSWTEAERAAQASYALPA
ncbi:hypothetical protein [Dongia sp.]|uniref:hypothetical protein n=1 Tax=Dongia sp. TaxID=1977262 RepID=UPI0035B469FD